ncbi:MAG: 2-dehydropantoate 2-reductase [Rhodospirillaceae bacterium]|jgi:2-dehydropantoate 2-reductase|nr:2-dehydropantoate 2-reductase [Rhodospirillaceae bacterium]MBT3492005.1 2-dehydropantoate 2-reductase [Rhodospirillaceae bacterium]MBT3779203.1 2-dehydropantoate 2-reductase [Rhodospirillaceae bacterium]MBT3979684.1 2-dehydropantoate 2-reductase [Rhodospirillaceae bacterium]MBT4168588.1 2-dehydropantoate 2-reductase [Rhodospirillaceae bacterium]
MKICIIGAGAMGGLYGGHLLLAGHDVQFIEVRQAAVDALNNGSYIFDGIDGEHRLKAPAATSADGLPPADIAFIHTDSNNTQAAGEHAKAVLKPEGWAVTFQNGVGNVETLSDVLGAERVVGGISYHSAASPKAGHATHTNANKTWIGELNVGKEGGGGSARVEQLRELLAASNFDPHIADDIQSVIWTKFMLNCAVNPLCAISGLRSGEVGADDAAVEMQELILDETLAVIAAKGIALMDPDPKASIKRILGRAFNKPSMLQHMEAGLRTEIDSLNGAVVREGAALGIPTPYNHALTMMIKARNANMIRQIHEPPIDYAALEAAAQAER